MARHESGSGQVHTQLPSVSTKQGKSSKASLMAQTTGNTTATMEGPEHGFRTGLTGKREVYCHMGSG
jgi:hypothetical protein